MSERMNQPSISAESLMNSWFQLIARDAHKNGILIYAGKAKAVRQDLLRTAQRVLRESTAEGVRK